MNDTYELIKKSQQGSNEAREELINENSGLIWACVRKFGMRGFDLEDLYQIGAMGLLKAIDRFDCSYGVKFSTYAVPLIYGEIRRYIRDDGMIKISRKLKELNYKINNIRADYIAEYGTEPTIETIKQHIGCTVEEITLATEACRCVESIDANLCDDVSTLSLIQRIKNNDCEEDRTIARLDLMESLSSLNEKERLIIFMRYISDKTQAEVGKKLGLSQVQVSRLERKSLTVIKKYMSG